MLKTIDIQNFRGFRRFTANVGRVTAFLGPNSSGKTTVLHAVRLACDALRLAAEEGGPARVENGAGGARVVVTDDLLLADFTRLLPLSDWRALFVDRETDKGNELQVTLGFDERDPIQEVGVRLVCANNQQIKLVVKIRADAAVAGVKDVPKKSQKINLQLTEYVLQHAPIAVFVPPFYGTVRDEEYRARVVVDRLLGSGDQSHVVRNLVGKLEPDQFERLSAFLDEAIGARLVHRTTADDLESESPLVVRFRDSNGDLELSAAGAGLVNLIALYSALSRWRLASRERRVLFLLDEPEAHLHPRLQAESAARLARLAGEFNAQLCLATHSVDILNRLAAEDALLVRCDRREEPSALALESDSALFDDLASWVDLTPYTAINLLASRRVAFCEGDDEVKLLPRLAALYFANDPERHARFRKWALVRLHGASNRPVAELLARLVASEAVRAQARSGSFHVVVVLDRDHDRVPGWSEREANGVVETTRVWSQHSLESLFVDPTILSTWIRAFVGDAAPSDLAARVARAIAVADQDSLLRAGAVERLQISLSRPDRSDRGVAHALREANRLAEADPAVWQRGKDRARVVLQNVREGLPVAARQQFPADVCVLVERAKLNRIGERASAIPVDVAELLDRLAAS